MSEYAEGNTACLGCGNPLLAGRIYKVRFKKETTVDPKTGEFIAGEGFHYFCDECVIRVETEQPVKCKKCGCTEEKPCHFTQDGKLYACSWFKTDLCSMCAAEPFALDNHGFGGWPREGTEIVKGG